MLKSTERQAATQALWRETSSKFVRYIVLALALTLLPAGENPFTVQAREEMTEAGESLLHSFHRAHGFHTITPQRSRHRRRSRRRRSRKPYSQAIDRGTDSKKSGRVQTGAWGGEHIALQVSDQGATFEIDCAHGSIEELFLNTDGRFDSRGVYVREHGGPDREGQQPDTHSARYTGWSDGKRMKLKITLTDTGQTIGEFDLTLGAEPQMTKCL